MTIVRATDFRKNVSHYLKLADKERVIITLRSGKSYELVPDRNITDDGDYFTNPAVKEHLDESIRQADAGRTVKISAGQVRKDLGL